MALFLGMPEELWMNSPSASIMMDLIREDSDDVHDCIVYVIKHDYDVKVPHTDITVLYKMQDAAGFVLEDLYYEPEEHGVSDALLYPIEDLTWETIGKYPEAIRQSTERRLRKEAECEAKGFLYVPYHNQFDTSIGVLAYEGTVRRDGHSAFWYLFRFIWELLHDPVTVILIILVLMNFALVFHDGW